MQTTGEVDFRWELSADQYRSMRLGDARIAFTHPALGSVDCPARITSSAGRGIIPSTQLGDVAADLDHVLVHWMNIPSLYPAEVLSTEGNTWAGRWSGSGGGWAMTLDARADHSAVASMAKGTPFHVVTHVGVLKREDGATCTPDEASAALDAWHVAFSFYFGRWVAPSVAVGIDPDAERVWEEWAWRRCDAWRDGYAWGDAHRGDDLRSYVSLFLAAWYDTDRHDRTRYVAHHIIEANEATMTLEARIMLVSAALEYLSWVSYVVTGKRTAKAHRAQPRNAALNLRELLVDAGIDPDIPNDLDVLRTLRTQRPQEVHDGPSALTWVRNRLVHPKDAGEPYRMRHLVLQSWQLVMHYGELLLLRDLTYVGAFKQRFPLGGSAHGNSRPVPWV